MTATVLEREEYIEQAYFFRVLRERMAANLAAQDIMVRIHEEILSTTRLPLAIQLIGLPWNEANLLAAAAWCEQALGIQPLHPKL